jgi:hypothetical protein
VARLPIPLGCDWIERFALLRQKNQPQRAFSTLI